MLTVGLTGGIGAGKSTVTEVFAQHGAIIVDADKIARQVVQPGTEGLAALVQQFGEDILTDTGELNRPKLAEIAFSSPENTEALGQITHPLIGRETALLTSQAGPGDIVVHDVPLLTENNLAAAYDVVIVVWADIDTRLQRLSDFRGMDLEDAKARMAAQATDAQREAIADIIIDNSGEKADTIATANAIWSQQLQPRATG